MLAVLGLALTLAGPGSPIAATCSCAGVPLLSTIDTSASEAGQFYINYSVEDHQISDLVSGSDDVRDETGRDRSSISQTLSASYAFSDTWSVSALVSHVEHRRRIGSSAFGESVVSGVGDSAILVRFTPLYITPFSRHEISLGAGARLPTGEDDAASGAVVSEDMQPGVGATGWIGWGRYTYAFNQAATVQFNASLNYTRNRSNDRGYSFGDESSLSLGIGHTLGPRFSYSAALRYRHTRADERSRFLIPNTGGEWLDIIPAIQYSINDRLDVGLFGRIPIARELKGALQFTTSYSYGLSLTYGF